MIQEAPDDGLKRFRLFGVEPVSSVFQGDKLVLGKQSAEFRPVFRKHVGGLLAPEEERWFREDRIRFRKTHQVRESIPQAHEVQAPAPAGLLADQILEQEIADRGFRDRLSHLLVNLEAHLVLKDAVKSASIIVRCSPP